MKESHHTRACMKVCHSCQAPLHDDGPCPYCLGRKKAYVRAQKKHKRHKLNGDAHEVLEKCPQCGEYTLVRENGCAHCVNPECLFAKCN